MREIKFRAMEGDEFVYGLPSYDLVGNDLFVTDLGYECKVSQNTLGQYTGLKDRNGVEIYEGDILQTDNGRYKVEYIAPSLSLISHGGNWYDTGDYYTGGFSDTFEWGGFKVVGNIYENPELLECNNES